MQITLHQIPLRQVVEGYKDSQEAGVVAYGGRLDVRPPYQREFVYKGEQRDAVVRSVRQHFPLNVMYWVVKEDGNYEVLDGQQRTISLCQYVEGLFSLDGLYFHNLSSEEQAQILDYELMVYHCVGSHREKLYWFNIVNVAGEKLTAQELRNAVYAGPWLADAKRYFSKQGCAAYRLSERYVKAEVNRQGLLEVALEWASGKRIEAYMGAHQHDPSAEKLWQHFCEVIEWVQQLFPTYNREMQKVGVHWGALYADYGQQRYPGQVLDARAQELMKDDEISKKSGIYLYLITGEERHLNLRTFDNATRTTAFHRQGGICPHCQQHFAIEEMEADHITPWCQGGKTVLDNCQMLCRDCNRRKGGR